MNAKVEAVIDGFSNTGIHADYVHTVKMPDNTDIHVIHVENGSFTQGGVIKGTPRVFYLIMGLMPIYRIMV